VHDVVDAIVIVEPVDGIAVEELRRAGRQQATERDVGVVERRQPVELEAIDGQVGPRGNNSSHRTTFARDLRFRRGRKYDSR